MAARVDPTEFKDRRVVVTGGTRGAGRAAVSRFLAAGARILTSARSARAAIDGVDFVQADLATSAGTQVVAEVVMQRLGGVDVLVHVLGASNSPGAGSLALTHSHWQAEIDLNLMAAVRLDRALVPHMIHRRSGSVVHLSSI